ncbi:MAG: tRNA (adenosine(37)-N6)-dimethylallyltransferase MiaA, partial [Myxococcaceae bacterium]|nr:tRNA (adenosine(37)-N6)-dimethylallyltransferase MiaA [Myxococcaceae bacterium]
GLYLRVLLHGVVPGAGRDEGLRAALAALGDEALHERLRAVDPVTAERLPVRDRVRVTRAIELFEATGEPASAQRARHAFASARHPYRLWVLDPPRAALYAAIDARTKAMFDAGLVDETRRLVAQGFREAAPMRAVGYAQALAVVDGVMTEAQAVADVAQKTRHYAKRQWTWFRKEQGARFVQPPFDVERFSDA